MGLAPLSRLGSYEIVNLLGAGGMGEVYRAKDVRLGRDVAIKVLPAVFAADPDRLARFEQEARSAAAINHPNILAVHDIGQHGGAPFLVSELLEGQSLREVLDAGPLPVRKAVEYGVQIAQGLAAAHDRGIVHRDLKPENVFITFDGRAKILDFGLAKLTQSEGAGAGMSVLPTTPAFTAMPHTMAGMVMGTMGYMSPEQVRGGVADHRSDIFALGVVLHEMLSGKRAFGGDTAADVMSGILKEDPPELPLAERNIPPALARIVSRCLEKNPAGRFQSARDLAFALEALSSSTGSGQAVEHVAPTPLRGRTVSLAAAALGAVALTAVGVAATWFAVTTSAGMVPVPVAKVAIALPPGDTLAGGSDLLDFDISADGRAIAYAAAHEGTTQLFVRTLDSPAAQLLAGTEGATSPFFSPDARSIGFFARGKLRTIAVASSETRELADVGGGRGGWWAEDGFIYFTPSNLSGIQRVAVSGGPVTQVTTLDRERGEISHRWPQVLPGGKAILFTAWTGPARDNHRIELYRLDTHTRVTIAPGGDTGRYATGYVLYGRLESVMAIPFDLSRLAVTGTAMRTGESTRIGGEGALFAVSQHGDLLRLPGDPHRLDARIVWVDRSGHAEAVPLSPQDFANTIVSPDGHSAAFNVHGSTDEIGVADFSRGTLNALTRNTNGSQAPVWSPDGRRIAYRGTRKGFRNVYVRSVDGLGDEQQLTKSDHIQTPLAWSSDGKYLLFVDNDPVTATDLWVLSVADGKTEPVVRTPLADNSASWSPDGRWIAYTSSEAGRPEVFVQAFPSTNQRWRVSTAGGDEPVWSHDGREIFYRDARHVMAVDVRTVPRFMAGTPHALFDDVFVPSPNSTLGYSVSPDGKRFLFVQRLQPDPAATSIDVVLNWFTELQRTVSSGTGH